MTINENMYREIVENAQEGIWITDSNAIVSYVNFSAAEMLGFIKDDIIGQPYTSFLTEEYSNLAVMSIINKYNAPRQVESIFKCKDGTGLWAAVTYTHKFNDLGEYIGSQAFVTDIKEHKQSEALIKNSEDRYRDIFEYSTDCIFVVDVEDEYKFKYNIFNPAEELSTGLMTEQVSGKFVEEIFNEELSKELNKNYRNCCEQGVTISYDEGLSLPSGFVYFQTSLIPIKNSNGKVTRILGISSNITKMKSKQIELQGRIELESAISTASRLFISRDQIIINEVLKKIGETVSVNRAYVFQLTENSSKMDNLYEWCSHNTEPQIDMLQGLDSAMFPWWIKQLQGGNNIIFSDIKNLPPEAVAEKNILQEQDIKSIFVAPILSTYGTLTGFIGFDDTEKHREWSDEDSKVLRVIAEMIGMYWDRNNSENQLKELLEKKQSMINNHGAIMLLIEPLSGKIVEANSAATRFYGYSNEELINMFIHDINILDKDELDALRIKALDKGQKYITFPHRLKNGEIKFVDTYSSTIDYSGKKVLFSIIFDVTKREEVARENEYLAYHDYLTGLYNRRFYKEEFDRRVKEEEFPVGILIGDMNGFKIYNDTFGYAEGDRLLKEMSALISEVVNDNDVVARIGGDEFAIIVSGKNEVEISQYLDKIEEISNNAFPGVSDRGLITISWGYGIQRKKEDTLDILSEVAESFMYNKKFYSRNSARSNTVDVIMKALFTKSEREEQHSKRVGALCAIIAQKMDLRQSEIDKIRVAGLLHDIGKIGIDENILNKKGNLDAEEWKIMKLHPAKGASILENTKEYHDISDIVLAHHERYDGTGYPRGLKAELIPLWARIIAVADTYDAMTNLRSYRQAVSKKEAAYEIKKCSNTQFDPQIVDLFLQIIN